ncbi:MAG: TIGR02186 family protein [Boseongicola sp.]
MLRLLALMVLFALPAEAEEVVAGMSQNRVQITTNFDGSEILIFGAVKRETPLPEGSPLQVIITVEGPSSPVTIRRKAKRFGIWINSAAVEVDEAPSFYAVSTSAAWRDVIKDIEDLRHKISIDRAIRAVGLERRDGSDFVAALIRIRRGVDAYFNDFGGVEVTEETLFRASVKLPANLTEGDYITRFFLTRDGEVVDVHESVIDVRKVGLEQFLFNLSRQQPFIYGIMSLTIAIIAGWLASAIFRWIRV